MQIHRLARGHMDGQITGWLELVEFEPATFLDNQLHLLSCSCPEVKKIEEMMVYLCGTEMAQGVEQKKDFIDHKLCT